MSDQKDYRIARKKFWWIPTRSYTKTTYISQIPNSQRKITEFITWIPDLTGKYLYRFPRIKTTRYEDFAQDQISLME